MWPTVVLILGIILACDAAPSFNPEDVETVRKALENVREDYNSLVIIGSRLRCSDSDPNQLVTIAMDDGSDYLKIKPANLVPMNPTFTGLYVINSEAIDYELTAGTDDKNTQNDKKISLVCENQLNEQVRFDAFLVITDVNDHAPDFERKNTTYQITIKEVLDDPAPVNISANSQVGAIIVSDKDGVDNNHVEAVCTSMDVGSENRSCDGFFSVVSNKLPGVDGTYLFTVYALRQEYLTYASFNLRIQAVNVPNDPNEPTLNSTTQNVLINILDIQNEPPSIDQNALYFEMYEDLAPGLEVARKTRIGAFDQDVRNPNAIRFELRPYDPDPYAWDENKFYLGLPYLEGSIWRVPLFLNNSIDRESVPNPTKTVYITVVAIEYDPQNRPDRNPMTSEALVSIRINDVNDRLPTFSQNEYRIEIEESQSSANPQNYYQISNNINLVVRDEDSGLYNSYSVDIVSGNYNGMFRLNKNTGSGEEVFVLYAREQDLDYETQPNQYELRLQARDFNRTEFRSEAVIYVNIIDANDHDPEFQSIGNVFVREDAPIDSSVAQVIATDRDSGMLGTIVRYEILDRVPFDIDNNGVIYLREPLDYETKKSYLFSVKAYDGGVGADQNEGTYLVTLIVQNVLDKDLVFDQTYSATLTETSLELVPPIQIRATSEEDETVTIEYSIVSIEPPVLPLSTFSVNRFTGNVSVNQFINYKNSTNGTVLVTLRASAGLLSSTTDAVITIIDLNNFAPVFLPVGTTTFRVNISELAQPGEEVIRLQVEDQDGPETRNGQVQFEIESGANDDFKITQDTGVIIVRNEAVLDREARQESYSLSIIARDLGNPMKSSRAVVIIYLNDANNKDPVFEKPLYTFQINHGDTAGIPVGYVSASDLDSESRLNYSIDTNTAVFQHKASPVNDFIPVLDLITIQPQTGLIEVAGFINRDRFDRISFKVVVEDVAINKNTQPIQTGTASVVIFIQAIVDERIYFTGPWTRANPVITKTTTETRSSNTMIVALVATDPVIPKRVTKFRKIPSSDPGDYFQIQDSVLFAQKPLDYEEIPGTYVKKLSCVVEAISDDEQRTSTATIEVVVQDLNDNPPVFENTTYRFTVPEGKGYTYPVGRVKATDRDSTSYGQVEYFLAGSNHEDFYTYTDRSGTESEAVILVAENSNIDYETLSEYNLLLYARDNPGNVNNVVRFSASVPVTIFVEDVNDMDPVFDQEVYEFSTIGTRPVNGDVGFVVAYDGDAGRNGDIIYSIINSTNEGNFYFGMDTMSETSASVGQFQKKGRIFVQSSLRNLPDRSLFELTVAARDRGIQPRIGTAKVRITVSKGVQDLKPKWDERLESRVTVEENRPVGSYVTKVTAYAADVASTIIYSFVGAGDTFRDYDSFNIDAVTGEITTAIVLDHEAKRTYNGSDLHKAEFNLLILATDSVNKTLTNQFLLTVQVIDVDDNVPSFLDCDDITYEIPERASVLEEQLPGQFVFQARACDRDDEPHNRVKYSWFLDDEYCLAENLQRFNLDQETGVITTKVRLDRERRSEYLLCVEAVQDKTRKRRDMTSDLKARDNHDTVLYVLVTVLDINDLGPKFREPEIKKVILKYPVADVSVAEAYDDDLPPNSDIRYSIDSIKFVIDGIEQNAPTAFTVNGKDGTISIGTNDYTDYVGGYFDITIKAEDYNGADVESDLQLQRVYVTDHANRIRVVINRPADEGVDRDAKEMIRRLNALDSDVYYEIKTISYHVTSNNEDPRFDRTDVCMVVVREDSVLTSVSASKQLNDVKRVHDILEDYGALDPGPCDPASSVYPVGWESYWWVLVAFAIFIFICCLILIFMICELFRQYKQYMESRRTYLVPNDQY